MAPTYAFTPRAFGRPIALTLEDDALVVDDSIRTQRLPLDQIVLMRLTYQPTNMLGRSFSTRLVMAGGRAITIDSRHMAGMARIEDRTPAYSAFIRALAPAIAKAGPACRFAAGRPMWSFAFLAAVSTATGIAMAALLVHAFGRASAMMFIVLAAAAGGLGWVMWEMVRRNRPRAFDPAAPPADLLG